MADKKYSLDFTLSDGSTKSVQFTAPQGPKGDKGDTGPQGPAGESNIAYAFYVTISGADGVYAADKSFSEVWEAKVANRPLYCSLSFHEGDYSGDSTLLPPLMVNEFAVVFSGLAGVDSVTVIYMADDTISVGVNKLVDVNSLPTQMPNPHPLVLTGAASGTYDGSGRVTVNIPTIAGPQGPQGIPGPVKGEAIHYIEGTGTTAGTWLGTCEDITEYYDGLTIAYKIGIAGASTTTLNINGLGAKTVKRATANLTTHLGVNTVVHLTYTTIDGVGYWVWANYDSGNTKVTQSQSSTATGKYPVLLSYYTQDKTTTTAQTVRRDNNFYYQASTGTLTVDQVNGNAASASKVNNALTFTGEVTGTYDGSAVKTVNIPKAVRYESQTLTEAQKTQARTNMGLDSAITYDTFPAEDVVNAMADWTVFKTRGFYSKDDGLAGAYVVKSSSGSLYVPYGSKYIAPYKNTALVDRDIYVDQYGVRRGDASYAARNSEILTSLMSVMQSGFTLHFGSGQYYFSDPITCDNKYIVLKGVCTNACMPGSDVNIGTYLHFPDLADGEAAITFAAGAAQDLGIVGNPSICDVNLDRTKTLTDPSAVVTLVDTGTTYGIKPGTWGYTIQNVRVKNFTYGIYSETGNFLIDGITARQCKVGISAGNDVKITNVQLWNVMTGIELRGALASATNIRGDSIGKHLIHCWNGKANLVNIDGDYCVGSLIHYGGGTATYIHLGQAVACMGRVATKNVYSRDATFDLRTLSDADYEYCSYISIAPNTRVFGGHIELVNVSANPMDSSSGYVHPNAPISIGTGSTVKGVTIKCNVPYDADTEHFNKCVIKNLSTYAEASNDTRNYLTDFDGQTIEDIVFITPVGLVRSRRTSAALDRTLEFDSEVKTKVSEVISAQEVLVPGINLNDGVYEEGYFNSSGAEYIGSYSGQCFRNVNYIPVEGGKTIAMYYDKDTWNGNDKGKAFYIIQYDENKNVVNGRESIIPYVASGAANSFTLAANTAYVRLAFHRWAALNQDLTTIKIGLYYLEDYVSEFVEYGYDVEQTYGVMGEKVFLTSPNGTPFVLTVSDSGVLSVAPLNPT